MTHQALPSHEQITALLTGKVRGLVQEYAGVEPAEGYDLAAIFTVTRSDVHAYVERHGIPKSAAWSDQPGSLDGLYMIHAREEYHIYLQERGSKFDGGHGSVFKSKAAAEAALTDYLLAMSGCGSLFPLPTSNRAALDAGSSWLAKLRAVFGYGQ